MTRGGGSAIRVEGLHVRYPGVHALRDVDLSIAPGAFALVGGLSGSGKSTLAEACLGLLSADSEAGAPEVSGQVSVAGLVPGSCGAAELASRIGLVFQNPATQLFNGTVEEEVAFGPRNLGLAEAEVGRRVGYAVDAVGCRHLLPRSVRHLSGGEQQRVAIASSLSMRPSILILDEPTANLDQEGTASVVAALNRLHGELGITVVVIEHRLEPFLDHADRLIWLQDGCVVADGPPKDVLGGIEVAALDSVLPAVAPGGPLVSLEDVTVGYNGRPVLRDCSMTLREGEIAALVGPNGSGKSTAARAVAGLLRPWRGRVKWHKQRRGAERVGFLQQNPLHQLVCGTVGEEIRFAPTNFGLEGARMTELLAATGLDGLLDRPTQALSVGEQQRTALAASLSMRPRLVVLDEPTIGQDRHNLQSLTELMRSVVENGRTVLLITHDSKLVSGCAGRVWEIEDGRVQARVGA